MRFAFLCKERGSKRGSVAVVGAGPAGLAAAGYLACQGYDVDVYDKLPYAGGLMVFAIPTIRIHPDNVIEGVEELRDRFSVRFHFRVKVFAKGQERHDEGDEFVERAVTLEEVVEAHDATLIATGTWSSRRLGIEGEDAAGVLTALEYLYHWRLYEEGLTTKEPPRAKRVVVIGAGLSAVDAVEKALESGAEAYMAYRRTMAEAPAGDYMVKRLVRLGAKFIELAQPKKVVVEGGKAVGVEFLRARLGEPDETGRPRPVPIPGSEYVIHADLIVTAVGEIPTPPFAGGFSGIAVDKGGRITVNKFYQTGIDKVFAAGDVVMGPSFIGKALSSGFRAAKFLDAWLSMKGR